MKPASSKPKAPTSTQPRNNFSTTSAFLIISLVCLNWHSFAAAGLPPFFSNNKVLQQNAQIDVWGWADPFETVKVVGSWNSGGEATATAQNDGQWHVRLKTTHAGGPYTVRIVGSSSVEYTNILLGEVWLCGGQSNMSFPLTNSVGGQLEAAIATNSNIRFFTVGDDIARQRNSSSKNGWCIASPESAGSFSAVGYYFGMELQKRLGVPVGLIDTSRGCTHIEQWIDKSLIENNLVAVKSAVANTDCNWAGMGNLYDSLIRPLVPSRFAGVIWYQGESNRFMPDNYDELMTILIGNWRRDFGETLPFYFVQIAPCVYSRPELWQPAFVVREKQAKIRLPHTGMVVISDLIDDIHAIHPLNKRGVGMRLARMALGQTYAQNIGEYKSPMFKQMAIETNKIRVFFDNADTGLECHGKSISCCLIAGADRKFVPAKASVSGNTLVIWNEFIPKPVAVRFCFDNVSIPNVFSHEGLPVAPFRTDDWEIR